MYIPGVPDHTCDEITHPFSEITFRAEILDNKKKEAGRQAGRHDGKMVALENKISVPRIFSP